METPLASRLRGGLLGLLVGDALGVPYEFHAADALPPRDQIEPTPPPGFARSHGRIPPGTWSDDGAQALVLLDSLLERGRFDAGHFGAGLLRWYGEGFYAVDGVMFDCGVQTRQALDRIRAGADPATAGRTDERANGNGSLMRVLPLALWHPGSDAELCADAFGQSALTHRHLRAQVCCALYCLWVRSLLDGQGPAEALTAARSSFDRLYPAGSPEQEELNGHILPTRLGPLRGTGYVVDSLRAALVLTGAHPHPTARAEATYEDAVRAAIALGDDTDTTGCVTGGAAGILSGEEGIPERWLGRLRGRELVDPLLERLVAVRDPATPADPPT